jgi:UDP-glucose 4-epimerase
LVTATLQQAILVTGACGHIGQEVCRQLRAAGRTLVTTDVDNETDSTEFASCDLRQPGEVAQLFRSHPVGAVIHLAAVLPTAYHSDPLAGAAVNLTGSLNLLREAVNQRVKRFVFASSVSVYGLFGRPPRPLTEDDPTAPDEPYGASKRAIEVIGESLHHAEAIEFAALRIARVVGLGIKKTNSPWRAQIFESVSQITSISIPYAADAEIGLLHVEDAARMLITLAEAKSVRRCIYNCVSETWQAGELKRFLEQTQRIQVELGPEGAYAGAICDGSKFAQEFGFHLRGVKERLQPPQS